MKWDIVDDLKSNANLTNLFNGSSIIDDSICDLFSHINKFLSPRYFTNENFQDFMASGYFVPINSSRNPLHRFSEGEMFLFSEGEAALLLV